MPKIPVFLVAAMFAAFARADPPVGQPKKPAFTIAKDTTFLTAPLDADGDVDYPKAINERLRQGVTPENNASVLYSRAIGPKLDGKKRISPEYSKWLQVPELPEEGDYFVELGEFMRKRYDGEEPRDYGDLEDAQSECLASAWTAKERPYLAAWLKANDKCLSLIVEGSKRSHYYLPIVWVKSKDDGSLVFGLVPHAYPCRLIARALTIRAMGNLGEGRPRESWDDLLAVHRFSRNIGNGASLTEFLVGLGTEGVARSAAITFLEKSQLTSQQLKMRLHDLRQIPSQRSLADRFDFVERVVHLQAIVDAQRAGLFSLEFADKLSARMRGKGIAAIPDVIDLAKNPPQAPKPIDCDWDVVLRNANRWFDRLVACLREKEHGHRNRALDQFEKDRKKLEERQELWPTFEAIRAIPDKQTRSQVFADRVVMLLMPPMRTLLNAADRNEQGERNTQIAFALAMYKIDQGRYPAKLDALVPKYLAQVSGDLFSGKELIYRPTDDGYLLYSVGVNGQDDGGRTFGDEPIGGDDLPIRMPRIKKKTN